MNAPGYYFRCNCIESNSEILGAQFGDDPGEAAEKYVEVLALLHEAGIMSCDVQIEWISSVSKELVETLNRRSMLAMPDL